GLDLMADAGFDPRASVTLWQNMARNSKGAPPEFLSTHPASATRIQGLQARMPQALARYEQARERRRVPDCEPLRQGG
ncbi:MAG: M48 family metalloprotease, partial [Pseudomonadota bacterium]